MTALLPYHFCDVPGCTEMVAPGHLYCMPHFRATVVDNDDVFFPTLEVEEQTEKETHDNP